MYCWTTLLFQAVSNAGLLVIIYVFHRLSQRLGEALQMEPFYHLFTAGGICIVCSMLIQFFILFNTSLLCPQFSQFSSLMYVSLAFMALGVTFSSVAALKYWGWSVRDIF